MANRPDEADHEVWRDATANRLRLKLLRLFHEYFVKFITLSVA